MIKLIGLICLIFTVILAVSIGGMAWVRGNSLQDHYRMVFTHDSDVYSALPDGRRSRQLTNSPRMDVVERVSTDGRWLLVESSDAASTSKIISKISAGGKHTQTLLESGIAEVFIVDINWTTDGKELLYGTIVQGEVATMELLNTVTLERQILTRRTSCQTASVTEISFAYAPRWSPDNDWIYFYAHRCNDTSALYRMRATAGQPELVTEAFGLQSWSPDGKWLIVYGWGGEPPGIYQMRPDGSERQKLTDKSYAILSLEDAEWLYLYLSNTIYRVRRDGTALTEISFQANYPISRVTAEWLYVERELTQSTKAIFGINLAALEEQNIASNFGDARLLALSPDHQWLYFAERTSLLVEDQVYRMRVGGSQIEKLPVTVNFPEILWLPQADFPWYPARLAWGAVPLGIVGFILHRRVVV